MPKKMIFKAPLIGGGGGRAWPIIKVPFDVEKTFGTRSRVSVKGTINGFAYRSSIFPEGNGTHMLMVNRSMREGAHAEVGDLLNVVMEPDTTPRIINVPSDFKKALAKSKKAHEFFNHLPPSHKKAYVEAILEAKKPETRARRIEQAVQMLINGENR
ncbi:MAG: DUF1905 domain-containing protein [Ignavibacteriales bacterium]|nr:DUF1905 domain-containing protein [Ignavibacteriales bacterium]